MREVRRVFAENPKDLDELYEKLFSRIKDADTPQKTCEKLLYWVAYSERQLSVEELDDAIMCDPELGTYKTLSERDDDRSSINDRVIRENLGTLLKVETKHQIYLPSQELVYLNHQSVYDYFQRIRDKAFTGKIDLYFARTCIWYLNAEEFGQPIPESKHDWLSFATDRSKHVVGLKERYRFLDYASKQWPKHIKTTEDARSEWKQIQKLFDREQSLLNVWTDEYSTLGFFSSPETGLAVTLDIPWLTELILSGDFGAAKFEENEIKRMVESSPKSFECLLRVDIGEISASSKIMNAVARRSSSIQWMKLLLENGASDIEITEALMVAAAENQNESMLRRVLTDRRNDIKITERVLCSAAWNQNEGVMRLLLTAGGNRIKITELVLCYATRRGNEGVMRLLLTAGRDEIKITERVLSSAAENWNEDVMRLLLTDGGNEIKITEQVLCFAARNWNKGVMRLLLTDGRNEIKITELVLRSAARRGNEGVMQLLLTDGRTETKIREQFLRPAERGLLPHY